jgi:hypothetical protein
VLRAFGNCSPEFCLAAARFSRGRNRRPGAQEVTKSCQRGWFGRGGRERAEERSEGGRGSPGFRGVLWQNGGATVSGLGQPGGDRLGFWGGKCAGSTRFK